MGIFDFLKKKKDNENTKEELKIFTIEEIENFLKKREENAKSKEKELISKIHSLLNHLSLELKEKNEKLKKVDLSKKEENQNIKDLVLENVKIYSNFIEELISSIENIKEENLPVLIGEINKKFLNFERTSKFSFGRANFLVGKEITTTKESIKEFFKNLNEIINEEKIFLEGLNKVNLLEKQISELKKEEENSEKIKKEIKDINIKRLELERQQEILKKQIVETEKSEEYLFKQLKKEKIVDDKKELEKRLLKLKTSVNWKKLNEIFHSVKKKMDTIKSYEEDFTRILLHEEEFITILKETNLETELFLMELNQIRIKKREIEEILAQKDELEGARFTFSANEKEIKLLEEKEGRISKKFYEIEEKIVKFKEKINEMYHKLAKEL